MKNLGWLSIYAVLVGLGVDGVAVKMGIKEECDTGRGLPGVVPASEAPLAGQGDDQVLPWAVRFGVRLSPPQALLLALAAGAAAVWLPVLARWASARALR